MFGVSHPAFPLSLFLLVIFRVAFVLCHIDPSPCLQQCSKLNTGVAAIGRLDRVCGVTDVLLNESYLVLAEQHECYWACNFAARHLGTCGCPNDCFADFGFGVCLDSNSSFPFLNESRSREGVCLCSPGYAGPDCSLVQCPNDCSLHGTCVCIDSMQRFLVIR